jgi:hypothetical protein
MRTHLLMAAAAAAVLLTTAAFAASEGVGSGIPHESRRAGDRYTVMTDNEELMCKVAASHSNGSWAPPPGWVHTIAHLRQEGDTRCTPSMTNGM